jgi:hypothetical protein
MANTSLGTLAISMSLWALDLGAVHYGAAPEPTPEPAGITSPARCEAGVQTPADDSDLEVVVCSRPLR